MDKQNIVIAIDGYSSCGKSTVAKALAKCLNYVYIDSGAMYRAVTLYFIQNDVNYTQTDQVEQALENIHIEIISEDGTNNYLLNGKDVTAEIREMKVSELVSEISTIRAVRESMVSQQRRMSADKNIVMDGRDIGTAVFPDADVKIFMTADLNVRAERRLKELQNAGAVISIEEVIKNLTHRDHQDTTRQESPLTKAKDAIMLDTSSMNEQEQLDFVVNETKKATKSSC
ncbi:(d)CMP kinase [Albibacterium indicum]|uniref:(d)CMP kinase n=1 Tax=Albibacterium indicum TaxID=2292082 RepID=UPI000E54D4C8|nr:(d)CMP kinase [Pedobacter indicus]